MKQKKAKIKTNKKIIMISAWNKENHRLYYYSLYDIKSQCSNKGKMKSKKRIATNHCI